MDRRYVVPHSVSLDSLDASLGIQLFLLISVGLFSGKLLDLGYFRLTTLVGSLLYTFSYAVFVSASTLYSLCLPRLFMVSIAHPDKYYQLFLSQGIGMGLGAGLLYVPAVAVQAHHFRAYRPLAVGVLNIGMSIAILCCAHSYRRTPGDRQAPPSAASSFP